MTIIGQLKKMMMVILYTVTKLKIDGQILILVEAIGVITPCLSRSNLQQEKKVN